MDISNSFIRQLGYKKIYKTYKVTLDSYDRGSIKQTGTKYGIKLSAYTLGQYWNEIFEGYEGKELHYFIKWYKAYAPFIEIKLDDNQRRRAYKGYMNLQKNVADATGYNLGDLGIYIPLKVRELQTSKKRVTAEVRELNKFIESLYSWAYITDFYLKGRENIEDVILHLTLDSECEFIDDYLLKGE